MENGLVRLAGIPVGTGRAGIGKFVYVIDCSLAGPIKRAEKLTSVTKNVCFASIVSLVLCA